MTGKLGSIYGYITHHANTHGQACAAIGTDVKVTFEELHKDIDDVSQFILSNDIKQGDCISLVMQPTYLHTVFILALDRLGITSHSTNFQAQQFSQDRELVGLDVSCVISDDLKPNNYSDRWITVTELPVVPDYDRRALPVDTDPEKVLRLALSSGSTGIPKLIPHTRDIIMKRALGLPDYGLDTEIDKDRVFIGMPYDLEWGYEAMFRAFADGMAIIPWYQNENFLELITSYKATHLIFTPITFRNMVVHGVQNGIKLDGIRWVGTGGAVFDARLTQGALSVFGKTVWNGYGSTEAGGISLGPIHENQDLPYVIGYPVDGVEIQIVDENNNILENGKEGIVRVKSDWVFKGYVHDPSPSDLVDGYYYTGDFGVLDKKGRISILGRADNVINVGGVKVIPELLEDEIKAIPDVQDAAVFEAKSDGGVKVCASIVVNDDMQDPEKQKRIIQELQHNMQQLSPQRVFFVSSLPRNQMGKILRRELSEALVK
jgi:acyl-coenzyme A synthetase/AMP-(fatty) acid ligase